MVVLSGYIAFAHSIGAWDTRNELHDPYDTSHQKQACLIKSCITGSGSPRCGLHASFPALPILVSGWLCSSSPLTTQEVNGGV
ncbi:hypothetical protein FIBSPDRAFT_847161, partial [Athelia psychrophila]